MMSTFKLAAFFTSGAVLSNGSDPWGCCYNVGFGAYMKECCQEPTQGGDVFLSSCRLQNRDGGATWFVEYETCAWMENNVWNQGVGSTGKGSGLKIDKPAVNSFLLNMVASDNSHNPQGCCFNVGFGDGMKECCQTPTQGGDVRLSYCNLQQRMGGATWFVENETCDWMERNVWGRGLPTTSSNVRLNKPSGDDSSNLLLAAEVAYNPLGCCFNVAFGDLGFGAGIEECCQEPTQGGDVRLLDCNQNLHQRRGGATWFVENETCAWMEQNVWGRGLLTTSANVRLDKPSGANQVAADPTGCCFHVIFGKDGTYGTPQWHPTWTPVQGGDVPKSQCNVQQGEKSATLFIELTCAWMEHNVWHNNPVLAAVAYNPLGCCFNVGFDAGMKECCQEPTQGGDVRKSDCTLQQRRGGATWFVENETCAWMESNVWSRNFLTTSANVRLDKPNGDLVLAQVAHNPLGCCFNVGFGAGMKECCQEPTQGGDVRLSDCNLQQRMGGATWFVENETCEWMEINVWSRGFLTTSSNVRLDKPSNDYNMAALTLNSVTKQGPIHSTLYEGVTGCCYAFHVMIRSGGKPCCFQALLGNWSMESDCEAISGHFVEHLSCSDTEAAGPAFWGTPSR